MATSIAVVLSPAAIKTQHFVLSSSSNFRTILDLAAVSALRSQHVQQR